MIEYRWKTRTAAGPWLPTREAAQEDAIEAGVARRDRWGQFWKGVFTEIETRERPPLSEESVSEDEEGEPEA